MRSLFFLSLVIVSCVSCAGAYLIPSDKKVEDLIANNQLQAIDKITALSPIRLVYVNDRYGLIEARSKQYLVEFNGLCRGLRPHSVFNLSANDSRAAMTIRAKFDKITDCNVRQFFFVEEDVEPKLHKLRRP
jgi:hypothetical protein